MNVVRHLNAGTLWSLPAWSRAPRSKTGVDYAAVRDAGFSALQHHWPEPAAHEAGLDFAGMVRLIDPAQVAAAFKRQRDWNAKHVTVHLGHGFESEDEARRLIDICFTAADRHGLEWSVETHRATVTQDAYRTLALINEYPDLRFTADLSHWYTGLELAYGDFEAKLDRLQPVFERVTYIHLRIGHSCTMQLAPSALKGHPALDHYAEMWRRCLVYTCAPEVVIAPELLPATVHDGQRLHYLNYAVLDNKGQERSDRWVDALELCAIVEALVPLTRP